MKSQKITAETILHKSFGIEVQGYKMESVNNFLDEIAEQINDDQNEIERLTRENETLSNLEKKLRSEINSYQHDISMLHEEKKILTKEKLGDVDIFKTIKSMNEDIVQIKKILENVSKR